jgi:hypothetical protein
MGWKNRMERLTMMMLLLLLLLLQPVIAMGRCR